MTGLGWRTTVCISFEHWSNRAAKKALPLSASARRAVISLRSWPEENAGPSAAVTIARTALSVAAVSSASWSAPISPTLSALRADARLSVSFRIAPLCAVRTRGAVVGAFISISAEPAEAYTLEDLPGDGQIAPDDRAIG